jgi:hypothetical protein
MDANENCVVIIVRDPDPLAEGDEDVAVAGHDDTITFPPQYFREPLGDIERHGFFRYALARNAAAVETAVAGIDHDCVKFSIRTPNRDRGGSEEGEEERENG